MIFEYTLDKQKPPHSLEDLKQAGYIEKVPTILPAAILG